MWTARSSTGASSPNAHRALNSYHERIAPDFSRGLAASAAWNLFCLERSAERIVPSSLFRIDERGARPRPEPGGCQPPYVSIDQGRSGEKFTTAPAPGQILRTCIGRPTVVRLTSTVDFLRCQLLAFCFVSVA